METFTVGQHVRYIGASDEQVRWGGNDDPRPLLTEGETYEIIGVAVHSWHTKLAVKGFDGWFNSVSFEAV